MVASEDKVPSTKRHRLGSSNTRHTEYVYRRRYAAEVEGQGYAEETIDSKARAKPSEYPTHGRKNGRG